METYRPEQTDPAHRIYQREITLSRAARCYTHLFIFPCLLFLLLLLLLLQYIPKSGVAEADAHAQTHAMDGRSLEPPPAPLHPGMRLSTLWTRKRLPFHALGEVNALITLLNYSNKYILRVSFCLHLFSLQLPLRPCLLDDAWGYWILDSSCSVVAVDNTFECVLRKIILNAPSPRTKLLNAYSG